MKDCKWNAAWWGAWLLLLFLRQVEKYAEILKMTGHFTIKVKNLTLMCKQDTLSYKLGLECFSLESSLNWEKWYIKTISIHACTAGPSQSSWRKLAKLPSEVADHMAVKNPAMLYLKKQSNSNQLACCGYFLQTVYYHANISLFPIFCIINFWKFNSASLVYKN